MSHYINSDGFIIEAMLRRHKGETDKYVFNDPFNENKIHVWQSEMFEKKFKPIPSDKSKLIQLTTKLMLKTFDEEYNKFNLWNSKGVDLESELEEELGELKADLSYMKMDKKPIYANPLRDCGNIVVLAAIIARKVKEKEANGLQQQ